MTGQPRGWSRAARRRAARAGRRPASVPPCDDCGAGPAEHPRTDASGVQGRVCDACQWDPRAAGYESMTDATPRDATKPPPPLP